MSLEKDLVEKVAKYEKLTKKALGVKLVKGLSDKEKLIAQDFLSMANNYYNDAKYFVEKKELLTALAAFSYAHAWLDAGVRAKLFDTKDDQLFTLP
ncbi:MAG: DUF357 domain-containing protein [Candidatus Diapherotrites archaeon]|jgi:hypothetical protein|uniref:DUF357 domain-containing protein n=1 Tax=Candidatus Iainarchaeum sp. TaxID=3101447 RepID=A0A7K4BZ28_9ARCH|nr:DUF357 domain-containing protein [Candidatus Diapherotrites archaeon]